MEHFRRIGRSAARGAVSVTALLAVAADARAQECIQQKPLPEGCHQTGGMLGCTSAVGIVSFPSRVDLSPDDETAYVSSSQLSVFDRDPSDGTLTQLPGLSGCISDDGSGGTCTDARSFGTPGNVAITSHPTAIAVDTAGAVMRCVAARAEHQDHGETEALHRILRR